jgi:hypothetical protein
MSYRQKQSLSNKLGCVWFLDQNDFALDMDLELTSSARLIAEP